MSFVMVRSNPMFQKVYIGARSTEIWVHVPHGGSSHNPIVVLR